MTTARREDALLSAPGLALALTVIAALAFVLPPGLARRIQQHRVELATSEVQAIALAMTDAGAGKLVADAQAQDIGVLSGPGDPVTDATDREWVTARTASIQSFLSLPVAALAPDPWLRALVINAGAGRVGGQVWLLSAGPNGIVDTPFRSSVPATPLGDDIAVRLPTKP